MTTKEIVLAKNFVTIDVTVQIHDKNEPPYLYNRKEPQGEAKQRVTISTQAALSGALSIDHLLGSLIEMASIDYDNDKKELSESETQK